jgi:hypothetical protein
VGAFGQELLEPRLRQRRGVGPGDADCIEAARARGLDQRGFDAGWIAQKSRLV